MRKFFAAMLLILGAGCCTQEGASDASRVGGIVGVLIGFGLFLLAVYLNSKGKL